MPQTFKLPKLPPDWEWVDEGDPDPLPTAAEAQKSVDQGIGSMLREISGPRQPEPPVPSFLSGVLGPVAKKAAKIAVPYDDPVGLGMLVASSILMPGSPIAGRVIGKIGGKALPIAEDVMSTGLRRVAGMGMIGGLMGGLSGAMQGLTTQLGGEAARKLTQFARMNAQAKDLAMSDPETLGKVVSPIIPTLGSMRSPKDFHLAFKKGAAQTAVSEAYATGFQDVSKAMQGKQIPSEVLTSIRTAGPTGTLPAGANRLMAGLQAPIGYSFDDMVNTIQRLRTVGWTGDEVARGLAAKDHRQAADALSKELMDGLPPDLAERWANVDGMYARGKRIIGLLDDTKLLDKAGNLNIPRLQQKIKSEGYSVRDSYQLAADAANIEKAIFRGAPTLAEDIPGRPGKWFGHAGMGRHGGFLSFFPKPPSMSSYAGQQPYGLSPFGGSIVGQMLRRGVSERANTLAAPEE